MYDKTGCPYSSSISNSEIRQSYRVVVQSGNIRVLQSQRMQSDLLSFSLLTALN